MEILMKPIGYIHSPYIDKTDAPRQGILSMEAQATIEILEEYEEGIADIQVGTEVVVIFYFHKSKGFTLKLKPRQGKDIRGVFSTRSPNRPNGIGLSIVRIVGRDGNRLTFQGVDMLEGTPVLDIKPYDKELYP